MQRQKIYEYSNMLSRKDVANAFDARYPADFMHAVGSARVAIAGLGGLGSNVAIMLARSGVGHLLLVDDGRVDLADFNRQAYRIPHIGQLKTTALASILREISPYMEIEVKTLGVSEGNAEEIFRDYPIVVENFDDPEQKKAIVRGVYYNIPESVIISGYGYEDEVIPPEAEERVYICETEETMEEGTIGLMASRIAICAGHEANQVIEVIARQNGIDLK